MRGVSDKARAAIRGAYLDGAPVDEIASAAGVSLIEAETYLRWWCDRGCPGAVTEEP
jgi:DNA-directed RNA polymerase specialized sigma24 family protein